MRNPSVVLRICVGVVLAFGLASIGAAQNREKFVISAKAGGINAVTGRVMVERAGNSQLLAAQDDLSAGDRVTTGASSQVEVLLNPGSYLRVGENSTFELADNSLANLRVRLIRGSAIVEATGLDSTELHINIVTLQARVLIVRRGVYRINAAGDSTELLVSKGRAMIDDDPRNVIKGGNEVVVRKGSFIATKLTKKQDQFDDWSRERANTLAKANDKLSARGLNTYLASFHSFEWAFSAANPYGIWAFSPFARCFTFVPFYYGWSSPYGYNYDRRGMDCGWYSGVCSNSTVDQRGVRIQPTSSGLSRGSSSGGASGGSSGGSIGNSQPPSPQSPPAGPPPSPAGPSDAGGRVRPKDPIN